MTTTTTDLIDAPKVLETLREIVAEFGEDYVYTGRTGDRAGGGCLYAFGDGQPDCIVGQVLHRLTPEYFTRVKDATTVAWSLPAIGLHYTTAARGALAAAQRVQDGAVIPDVNDTGYEPTWGNALRAAEEEAQRFTA